MKDLLNGLKRFQREALPARRELFRRLARGQQPHTLFVGCSDSRVDPNLILSTEPGELFVLRNAGNVIPPYGSSTGGEPATVEFAVQGLGVRQILVCGHSDCGAIKALLDEGAATDLPALRQWLGQFEATRRIVGTETGDVDPGWILEKAIKTNVLIQMGNLATHPVVAARLRDGTVQLIGCVYWIETGVVAHTTPNRSGGWDWVTLSPED